MPPALAPDGEEIDWRGGNAQVVDADGVTLAATGDPRAYAVSQPRARRSAGALRPLGNG